MKHQHLFQLALAALLAVPGVALAQSPTTEVPAGVSARASVTRYTSSPVQLTMTVYNSGSQAQDLSAPRDNRQQCTAAPLVRVLEVGTRRVVYPAENSGNDTLCAQDMLTKTVPAGGSLQLARTIDLPAGDYMIESWFSGSMSTGHVKLAAEPVRVTVW